MAGLQKAGAGVEDFVADGSTVIQAFLDTLEDDEDFHQLSTRLVLRVNPKNSAMEKALQGYQAAYSELQAELALWNDPRYSNVPHIPLPVALTPSTPWYSTSTLFQTPPHPSLVL